MKPFNIFVVVQPGLEDIAQMELSKLGYNDITRIKGGFFLKGHLSTVIKLNLSCRSITRVLIEIAQFEARSFAELEAEFEVLPWREYLAKQNVCIHVNSYESKLYHEKAIAERLINTLSHVMRKTMIVVNSPDEDNTQLIVVYVKQDVVTVRMDATGTHLHKRGFGTHKEDAPLRETIAAAMLYAVGWGDKHHKLYDPMCGSGTIAIEAALMLKKNLWSEFRRFAFQQWKGFKPELLEMVKIQLNTPMVAVPFTGTQNQETNPPAARLPYLITASDQDEKSIVSAKINAFNGGVENLIDITQLTLDKIIVDKETIIVTNPPWGKRISGSEILGIWKELHQLAGKAQAVYLILPEEQRHSFPYKYETLLVFKAGEIKVRFIKLEA